MSAIPAALSVHHLISTVGADVGFASLIGLALLVLLFFSQARETATLRHRADEAGLRIQELEAEMADLAEQLAAIPAEISVRAAGPRVGPAQPGVPVAAGAGSARALPPAAPAGVGAPALAAATRLIPDPVPALPEYQPATAAGNGNGSPRPVVAASTATAQRPVQAPPAGSGRPLTAPPPRIGGSGRPGRGPGAGQGRPPGPGQSRPGGPARPPGAPMRPPQRRSRTSMVLGGVIAAVAVAAVVVAVILLTGGKGASSASKSASSATLASHRTTAAASAVQPSSVTVSVLNGTDMQGLALKVSDGLVRDGYKKGSVANASDQTHTTTVVAYMTPAERRDALAVAKSLKLNAATVQPVDPTTKATACPPSQACTSAVVVTVGTDLAQQ